MKTWNKGNSDLGLGLRNGVKDIGLELKMIHDDKNHSDNLIIKFTKKTRFTIHLNVFWQL